MPCQNILFSHNKDLYSQVNLSLNMAFCHLPNPSQVSTLLNVVVDCFHTAVIITHVC